MTWHTPNFKFVSFQDYSYRAQFYKNMFDASGLIGQYAHGNEPSHHMAYLYNYAGAPWKTQTIIRQILDSLYDDQPNGLSGNEDCGQMSAWYILSAMGFYQVCPGTPDYVIGTPIFDKVTINLENGRKFIVKASHPSSENKYIQSVTLNGAPYSKSYFTHEDILGGAELVFVMGSTPNKNWGIAGGDRPSSEKYEPAATLPYAVTTDENFLNTAKVAVFCDDPKATIYYTTDGSRPNEKSFRYSAPVILDKTTKLRFASFKEGVLPSLPVSVQVNKLEFGHFKNWEGAGRFTKGLNNKYYHAQLMDVDDLDKLTPVETGVIPNFTIDRRKREDYFGYIYSGFLDIPKDGIYTISIKVMTGVCSTLMGRNFWVAD